ncbi:MAG: hypothetical protein IJA62_02770 [Ruminococcus sp.]|nr:hypothetical protein [Ruminococcus sp.]
MNNNTTPTAALGELFVDATREVLEKGRIKAQMARLERVMTADKLQLRKIYAEIGKMYVDNTLKKNSARLEYLYKAIDHLKLRLERAQARMDMLKEAHSVDECTEAFRAELSAKIKQAQDAATTAAYTVKKKAQDVAQGIGETAENIKAKITKGNSEEDFAEDETDFKELLADLEFEDDTHIEEEDAQISSILTNLDAMLKEVEEEAAEESPGENSEEDGDSAESAESFDF